MLLIGYLISSNEGRQDKKKSNLKLQNTNKIQFSKLKYSNMLVSVAFVWNFGD